MSQPAFLSLAEFCGIMSRDHKTEIRKSLWWRIAAANSESRRKQNVQLVRNLKMQQHFGLGRGGYQR